MADQDNGLKGGEATTSTAKGHDHHQVGNGGELHQLAGGTHPQMTNQKGQVVADDENSLKANERGPVLLEDWQLIEKTQHFDHERIPERVVHARGYGAKGYFELTESLKGISKAGVLNRVGEKTPVFVRFSTVAGNAGSSDVARDVRGFAVKMYTPEGNWDIVGNNIPVFFIQDAIKFTDLIHSVKQEPDRGFPQAQSAHDTFWGLGFADARGHAHAVLDHVGSGRSPRSFRMMEGFGVHTFRLINDAGESTYVKFHWRPKLGMASVIWDEALKISGADPDFHRRDLWNAIDEGNFPEWELGVQLFDEEFANTFDFDVLDSTKLIPEEILPLKIIGKLVLDRNVDNYFAETEQVAFQTTNVVPGIDFTNDPLLQGAESVVHRHAAYASGRTELRADSGERAEVSCHEHAARRTHDDALAERACFVLAFFAGSGCAAARSACWLHELQGDGEWRQAEGASGVVW